MPDLTITIADAAANPKRVKTEVGEVEGRPLDELIEADRYIKQAAASASNPGGVVFTKLVPPGA